MNEIETYVHCRKCYASKPKSQSMNEYARINVARTEYGILILCVRHKEQIAHLEYDWRELDEKLSPHCEGCGCNKC